MMNNHQRHGDAVTYSAAEGVAEVLLNRPEASNAVDFALGRGLIAALDRAVEDPDVRVVALLGAGKIFCGGGDLAAMDSAPNRSGFVGELADLAHRAVRTIHGMSKPVVCGVQGAAAGAGFALALGADLVVAGRSARFVAAYTSVGLTPDTGLSWLLPRAIGQQRATELILTSRPLTAERAQEWGIVAELSDDTAVHETTMSLARELAVRPANAVALSRGLIRSSWARSLDEHLDVEAATIAGAADGPEARGLINAFLKKA
jgi:2-(1,2-epoxy-1,2-dihydrophenyl)acetyl-CoA isomerase